MARRLARRGYLVVLPNLLYRQGLNLRPGPDANIPGSEEQDRMFGLMNSLSVDAVMADIAALLPWLSGVAAAAPGRLCGHGVCMSVRSALAACHRFPGQMDVEV